MNVEGYQAEEPLGLMPSVYDILSLAHGEFGQSDAVSGRFTMLGAH